MDNQPQFKAGGIGWTHVAPAILVNPPADDAAQPSDQEQK